VIVLDPGHRYELQGNKGGRSKVLEFFKDAEINGDGYDGTTIQEVLRALIERVLFLDAQVSGGGTLSFVGVWRTQILELEVRAAGRHGLCPFEARRVTRTGTSIRSGFTPPHHARDAAHEVLRS